MNSKPKPLAAGSEHDCFSVVVIKKPSNEVIVLGQGTQLEMVELGAELRRDFNKNYTVMVAPAWKPEDYRQMMAARLGESE